MGDAINHDAINKQVAVKARRRIEQVIRELEANLSAADYLCGLKLKLQIFSC